MNVILEFNGINIYWRFKWWYCIAITLGVLLLLIGLPIYQSIIFMLLYILIVAIYHLIDHEYLVYKIIHREHYIEMNYYHWNKKKSLKLDLLQVKIELSKRGSNLSVLDSIHFKEGKNNLLEIHQEKGFHKKYWTEEKVKEMYEILVNLQKEVKEKYGNKNDESKT